MMRKVMKRTQSVKLDEPTKHPVNEAPTIHQNQLMSNVLLNSAFIITFITAILYFSGWTYWKTYFEQFNIELTQMAIPYHLMITTGHFKIYGVIIFAVIYIFLKKQLSKDIVNLSIS
jgi:pilus assembly protein TadC